MQKNFNKLNDILFIKFKQVEDNKHALRDMLNYQKHFYPMQMQAIIGENMMNLDVATKDQQFVQFQQKRYEKLIGDLQKEQEKFRGQPDQDIRDHLNALDKMELKSTGWLTAPLDNVEQDFVTPLLNNYLKDLQKRAEFHDDPEAGFAANLRKAVRVTDAMDLVNQQFTMITSLKEAADNKEHQLEMDRIKNEHNKKIAKLSNDPFDFKKAKAFKRQNSYMPQLDEFGDIDDADVLKKHQMRCRRSIDHGKKREALNTKVKDVTFHRLDKDPFAQSVSSGGDSPRKAARVSIGRLESKQSKKVDSGPRSPTGGRTSSSG